VTTEATALPTVSPSLCPGYWRDACAHLSANDRVMKRLIQSYPHSGLQPRGDAWTTLARSIVGQQISVKAAQTVWNRLQERLPVFMPDALLQLSVDDMRQAGLSMRKVEYLQDLARHFVSGTLQPDRWCTEGDEDIIRTLVTVRGVGRWTAEMFLIFHLLRPNVLPLDDVGLMNGIRQAYFSGEIISRHDVRELATAWQPYCTVATWYIWRSLDPVPVLY
jgi:DNA-3-methyladenine glycosylase II